MPTKPIPPEGPKILTFTVPLVPPSVNHYVKHTRSGRHYVTAEAKAFKEAVAIFGTQAARPILDRGDSISGKFYHVSIAVYLAHGQRGDVDNFAKVVLDGLRPFVGDDCRVTHLLITKSRDKANPRTEITVQAWTFAAAEQP